MNKEGAIDFEIDFEFLFKRNSIIRQSQQELKHQVSSKQSRTIIIYVF